MRESPAPRSPVLRRPLLSWVAGFTEPLLPPARRAADEAELSMMMTRWPEYMTLCFAGFLAGAAATLPPTDPWRSMTPQRGPELGGQDARTGAVLPNGHAFGDWRSAADITPLIPGLEPEHDPSLVALATPLDPIGALLIAIAGTRSLADVVELCMDVRHLCERRAEDQAARGNALRSASIDPTAPYLPPLRWLLHRRRAYFGPDDHFFVVWAPAWIERARRILDEGRPLQLELREETETLASLTAPPGSYDDLVREFGAWSES